MRNNPWCDIIGGFSLRHFKRDQQVQPVRSWHRGKLGSVHDSGPSLAGSALQTGYFDAAPRLPKRADASRSNTRAVTRKRCGAKGLRPGPPGIRDATKARGRRKEAYDAPAFRVAVQRAVTQVPYMADEVPTEYFIQGITSSGKRFRPSDWSERLAGVMSSFGPKAPMNARGPNAYLRYSLYVRPTMIGDLKCVVLDSRLKEIEPMAFDFVMNFAKDNDLVVTEACELPPDHATQKTGTR